MNNKTIFDKHLYKEGLRSLKSFGFIFAGLLTVFVLLFCFGTAISSDDFYTLYDSFRTLSQMYALLYFMIIVLVVPVLTIRVFSFLTTRNGSDFYHSIPHTKQCVYTSFVCASITWTAICIVVPMVIGYVTCTITGHNAMSFFIFLQALLHVLAAALLVTSAISVACAITGTTLTNIITTGLILFFPRVFLYACRLMVSYLTSGFILCNGFFFGTRCNLVVQSIIGFEDINRYLYDTGAFIYTLLLSIAYFFLAAFLFRRRHSELAMKPTLGRKAQDITCLLIGASFSLIPIGMIILGNNDDSLGDSGLVFGIVTLYIIIFILMGVYELLTTKKVKNLIRLLPRTGILAIVNVVLILGLFGCKKLSYFYIPDAKDIKAVSFSFTSEGGSELFNLTPNYSLLSEYGTFSSHSSDDYFGKKQNAYTTFDESVKTLVADSFKETINTKYKYHSYGNLIVTVTTNFGKVTRLLNVSSESYNKLNDYLLHDPEFVSIYKELPTITKNDLSIDEYGVRLTKDQAADLYETAKSEIATLNEKQWSSYYSLDGSNSSSFGHITFATLVGNSYTVGSLPITPLLPKTMEKYVGYVNETQQSLLTTFEKAYTDSQKEGTHSIPDCYLNFYELKNGSANQISSELYLDNDTLEESFGKDLLALLKESQDKKPDLKNTNTYLIELQVNLYNYNSDPYSSYKHYIQVDKAKADAILTKYNKYMERIDSSEEVEENQ